MVAIVAAVALLVLAFVLYQGGAGPSGTADASAAPTLPILPTPDPRTSQVPQTLPTEPPGPTTDPLSVAVCKIDQLALVAGGWSGATGSMGGSATVLNVSPETCRVSGKPSLELRDKAGKVIATGQKAAAGAPVALLPGGVAGVIAVWGNWCADLPARPLSLRVSLAETKGTLRARVVDWNAIGGEESSSVPRCDSEGAGSTIDAPGPFAVPEPPEPVADLPACAAEDLAAFLGSWGAAAGTDYSLAAVFNQGAESCMLNGSPELQLLDAHGSLLATGDRWPDAEVIELPAGWAAVTYIGFADWCQPPPKLPLQFDLRIGGDRMALAPTSELSAIAVPSCFSEPGNKAPTLIYTGPFALPGSENLP
jgi:hypothetical protein